LSNSTVSMLRIASSARRSFTKMPARDDFEVEIAVTSGTASPGACGQAMTRTGIVTLSTVSSAPSPPGSATRSASSGSSSASAASAPRAWLTAPISIQWPSSITVISNAISHQICVSKNPSDVANEAT